MTPYEIIVTDGCLDVGVRGVFSNPRWWQERLTPYFNISQDFSDRCDIEICINKVDFSLPTSASHKVFELDAHMNQQARVFDWNQGELYAKLEGVMLRASQTKSKTRLDLRYGEISTTTDMDVLRLVRGILAWNKSKIGQIPVHASCIAIGDTGVAFTGFSGDGKTSFLSAVLANADNSSLITNDKGLLNPDTFELNGLPFAVTIGLDTIDNLSGFELDARDRVTNGEALIWPLHYCQKLGRSLRRSVDLSLIVSTRIRFDTDELVVRPIDSDCQELEKRLFAYEDRVSWTWLYQLISPKVDSLNSELSLAKKNDVMLVGLEGNPFIKKNTDLISDLILSSGK